MKEHEEESGWKRINEAGMVSYDASTRLRQGMGKDLSDLTN